jgi:hypothetical protein
LVAEKNAFLDHDSHVELRQLVFVQESDLRGAVKLGNMSRAQGIALAKAARSAPTLSEELQELVWSALTAVPS